jgi:thiol-disulfide isomerase/thioredoxin|tara:strand:- start:294 stop:704 length:411 start_codon:yes stop_codon:yes gene_type:complete
MRIILLFLIPIVTLAQQDVPDKYWIDDSNFESAINTNEAFGDDETKPVVVEFWAKFNEANCFAEWDQLENAVYYRVNIAEAPEAKKKYRVRMAPTIIIFKGGIKETVFKAGLDLELPADLQEIQEAINEVNTASKF